MSRSRITPKPGAPIRDPVTTLLLPAAGVVVDRVSAYWRRREAEGGVSITDEPEPTEAPTVKSRATPAVATAPKE